MEQWRKLTEAQREERRRVARAARRRGISGEVDFVLDISMLGSSFELQLRGEYQYVPRWPVFNAKTGKEMYARHNCDIASLRLGVSLNEAQPIRTDEWADIGAILLNFGLIPPEAMERLHDLVERDAKRKDEEARRAFKSVDGRAKLDGHEARTVD